MTKTKAEVDRALYRAIFGVDPAEDDDERDEPDDLDFGFDLGGGEPLGDEEDPWGDVAACPKCNGDAPPLGQLGRLTWYRCRDCGIDFHVQLTKDAAASASA